MKKILTFVFMLSVTIMHILPLTALADTNIRVVVNGQEVVFATQQPVVISGRTLVPARGVFERLGFEPMWNEETNVATLTRHDHTIVITIGSDVFTTNGTEHTLEVYAQIINGSTMIPLRAVLESIGYTVEWDDATSTVLITTPGNAALRGRNALIGTWDWLNMTYYVFSADGTGTMAFEDITWRVEGDLLLVCTTPDICTDVCLNPVEWNFSFNGNDLVLTGRFASLLTFTYSLQGRETMQGRDVRLNGNWNNLFATVATFNANGTGIFSGENIRWWTRNGILSLCNTPEYCGESCRTPTEWVYIISGDRLVLRSRVVDDVAIMLIR